MEESALNRYLDEIGKGTLLTDEQERELSAKILKGDERALSRLVEANDSTRDRGWRWRIS